VTGPLVVKLGGNALAALVDALAAREGRGLVVVHGGGAQITALMERRGIEARFVEGRRFTDLPTLACARTALADVSDSLVEALREHGEHGQSFPQGSLFRCRRRVDLGLVGEPVAVAAEPIANALETGRIPVIAPIGRDDDSPRLLNVNADDVAAAIAVAVRADELRFASDVPGVLDETGAVIRTISADDPPTAATGGMVPKLEACASALAGGVGRVRIGSGTEVVG
jgi:acetylglutamate kinase